MAEAWPLSGRSFLPGLLGPLVASQLQIVDWPDFGDLAAPVFDQDRIKPRVDGVCGLRDSDTLRKLQVLAWRAHGNQPGVVYVREQHHLVLGHRLPVVVVVEQRDVIYGSLGVSQVTVQLLLVAVAPGNSRASGREDRGYQQQKRLPVTHQGVWGNNPTGKFFSASASRNVMRLPVLLVGTVCPSNRFFRGTGSGNSFGNSITV